MLRGCWDFRPALGADLERNASGWPLQRKALIFPEAPTGRLFYGLFKAIFGLGSTSFADRDIGFGPFLRQRFSCGAILPFPPDALGCGVNLAVSNRQMDWIVLGGDGLAVDASHVPTALDIGAPLELYARPFAFKQEVIVAGHGDCVTRLDFGFEGLFVRR